jgi:hypothetical protein
MDSEKAYSEIVSRLKNLPREDLELLSLFYLVEWWGERGGGDAREEAAVGHFYSHAERDLLPKLREIVDRFDVPTAAAKRG